MSKMTPLTVADFPKGLKIHGEASNDTVTVHVEDMELKRGEFTVLMGPSGSGKSTLLRSIANSVPKGLTIGLVQQSGSDVFPWMTVRENLGLPFVLSPELRHDNALARIGPLIETFELSEAAKKKTRGRDLSGGERVRVAVARALVGAPGVILLDEPCAALDLHLRRTVYTALKTQLAPLNAAALLVSHNFDDVIDYADTTYVLARTSDRSTLLSRISDVPLPLPRLDRMDDRAAKLLRHLEGT